MGRKRKRIKTLEAQVVELEDDLDMVREDLTKLGMEFNIHVHHEADEFLWERELSE